MQRPRRLVVACVVATALAAVGGAEALAPDRTLVSRTSVLDLALTGTTVAYVADEPNELHCARIGVWDTRSGAMSGFDAKEQCAEPVSTGQGVWDVSIASTRVLWITYVGGNVREWSLWTRTTGSRASRRLRFVARSVDDPSPIVIGPGTPAGIPYAVETELVYLGDDGRVVFRRTLASPVRALAADARGRLGVRVAALLASGEVVGLDEGGNQVLATQYPPEAVVALGLDSRLGVTVQTGRDVVFDGGVVRLPRGARMVDLGQGRVLWSRAGDLGRTTVSGASAVVARGTPVSPALGRIGERGVVWAIGRAVRWRSGRLP
jgi:hypothetical protein